MPDTSRREELLAFAPPMLARAWMIRFRRRHLGVDVRVVARGVAGCYQRQPASPAERPFEVLQIPGLGDGYSARPPDDLSAA
jgi:hypothetical protein